MNAYLLIGFNSTTSASHCFGVVTAPDLDDALKTLGGRYALVRELDVSARALFARRSTVTKFTPSGNTWACIARAEAEMNGLSNDASGVHLSLLRKMAANYDQFYLGQAPSL